MYVNTVSISPRGQIVLPKKVRELLKSDVISVEVNEDDQIFISPVRDLGASLSAYQKEASLPFEAIREQVWKDSIHGSSNKE